MDNSVFTKHLQDNENLKDSDNYKQNVCRLTKDPRPDIKMDSAQWDILLKHAYEISPELTGVLHGIRSIGTECYPDDEKRIYKLRPLIGQDYWGSESDYMRVRNLTMVKFTKEIAHILRLLYEEEKAKEAGEALPAG